MNLNCPACNKSNSQPDMACVRCGCDLSRLWAIQRAAYWHLASAHSALAARDPSQALEHAHQSWVLLHSTPSARAGAMASAALGDLEGLLLWRQRAENQASKTP